MPRTPLAVVVAALVLLAACGDDDDDATVAPVTGDTYCELANGLDAAGNAIFAELGEAPSREDLEDAYDEFFDDHRDAIERYQTMAPEEIRADVAKLVELQREAGAGDLVALNSTAAMDAEARVDAYEDQHCNAVVLEP